MIFENRVRVENHFPVEIFEIFHFQKHAPIILKTLAKKFFTRLRPDDHIPVVQSFHLDVGQNDRRCDHIVPTSLVGPDVVLVDDNDERSHLGQFVVRRHNRSEVL